MKTKAILSGIVLDSVNCVRLMAVQNARRWKYARGAIKKNTTFLTRLQVLVIFVKLIIVLCVRV